MISPHPCGFFLGSLAASHCQKTCIDMHRRACSHTGSNQKPAYITPLLMTYRAPEIFSRLLEQSWWGPYTPNMIIIWKSRLLRQTVQTMVTALLEEQPNGGTSSRALSKSNPLYLQKALEETALLSVPALLTALIVLSSLLFISIFTILVR